MKSKLSLCVVACLLAAPSALRLGASAQTIDVLKSHDDNANTGQNLSETMLTPSVVSSSQFGLLYKMPVDPSVGPNVKHVLSGTEIYAQPLYMAGVQVAGKGALNLVFVATEHDSVYAFNADTGEQVWARTDYVNGTDRRPFWGNSDLQPEIGITGTPVIDPATNTLYVVVLTQNGQGSDPANFHQTLRALDCSTGADKFAPGFPVEITATSLGTEGKPWTGPIKFRPDLENQRPGLALDRGKVIIAWSSHQDQGPYHGWVMTYDAHTGRQLAAFNDSPSVDRYGAGIWQSGGSASIDDAGNLYFSTGNGVSDAPTDNWGESFIKLDPNTLTVKDYFTPWNHNGLDDGDADLGTSGLTLLPESVGSNEHPHLMISGGKVGMLYLVDRDNFGKTDLAKNTVVQEIEVPADGDGDNDKRGSGLYSVPAYFNGSVYYLRTGEYIKRVPIANGHLDEKAMVSNPAVRFGFPGATPSISADENRDGIVWATESYYPTGLNMQDHADPGHMRLHAYDAASLKELYSSGDTAPNIGGIVYNNFMKFNPPTIANGHVYVATGDSVMVYGLKNPDVGQNVTRQVGIKRSRFAVDSATGAATQTVTITNKGKTALNAPLTLLMDNLTVGIQLPLIAGSGNGATSYAKPAGVFYHNFPNLAPGKSATATLTFLPQPNGAPPPPSKSIDYQPVVLAGGIAR